ncbi:MAG: ComEC/Rec2 family competence protein [Armatimonadota bacterium]|jgi:competence protein ComEC
MRKTFIVILIILIAAAIAYLFLRAEESQKPKITGPALKVRFLDQDFGTASVLTMPDGSVTVVDPSSGRPTQALIEMLGSEGVKQIDVIISTPSRDCATALAKLGSAFTVNSIIRPELGRTTSSWRRWIKSSKWEPTSEKVVSRGDRVRLAADVIMEVLNPPQDANIRGSGDDSLVFKVVYKESSILYLSNIGSKGEAELIGSRQDLQSSIMVAARNARYGSNCLELLAAVRPQVCVVSALRNNKPSASVLSRLSTINTGATLFRTDKDGIIEIDTDGHSNQALGMGGSF